MGKIVTKSFNFRPTKALVLSFQKGNFMEIIKIMGRLSLDVHRFAWSKSKTWTDVAIKLVLRLCYLLIILSIIGGAVSVADQWNMPSYTADATITSKKVTEHHNWYYDSDGVRRPGASTFTYTLHLDVEVGNEIIASKVDVARTQYDNLIPKMKRSVRYKRGRFTKPFGSFKGLNDLFGFHGEAKVYVIMIE